MRIIALLNQKGGVGKTTSVLNIGAAMSILGKKVALIDLDPQANLTYGLGFQAHELENSIYDLLKGEKDFNSVVLTKSGMDLIPSTLDLASFDLEFASKINRENRLAKAMAMVLDYDYVLIDCPPSLGLLTINALVYAQNIFIVLQPEYFAMKGMSKLLSIIDEILNEGLNNSLVVNGIICSMYDNRKSLHREVVEKIRENFSGALFSSFIRPNVSLAEAQSLGVSIFEYKRNSNGAEDYMSLTNEIIKRLPV